MVLIGGSNPPLQECMSVGDVDIMEFSLGPSIQVSKGPLWLTLLFDCCKESLFDILHFFFSLCFLHCYAICFCVKTVFRINTSILFGAKMFPHCFLSLKNDCVCLNCWNRSENESFTLKVFAHGTKCLTSQSNSQSLLSPFAFSFNHTHCTHFHQN